MSQYSTIEEVSQAAVERAKKYRAKNEADGHKKWEAEAYMMGLMRDLGDLSKLIMVKRGYRSDNRQPGDLDENIAHEIADCFWSLFVIADQLGVDPKEAINKQLDELDRRLA